MNIKSSAVLILLLSGIILSGYSQCRSFTKKMCMPSLKPFIHNGQLNSINLFPGESASLTVPFYSGQDYRVQVCGHKILDAVYFEVKDEDSNVIYSSKDKKSNAWDLKVNAAQQLVIEVYADENEAPSDTPQAGCVALLVGFKQ